MKNHLFTYCLAILALSFLSTCSPTADEASGESITAGEAPQFRVVPAAESGVDFQNSFTEDYSYNILVYEYLYNGGGVAIGDINNDGLPDLYFSATLAPNKLYLNKGNFQFEDITEQAGVGAEAGFKTGVSMADINNDGLVDIFVCRTGKDDNGLKDNLVYINQGDLTFEESASELGLNDNTNTNHVAFLDYDLDGDLDVYLLNHRIGFKLATQMRLQQNEDGSVIRKTAPESPFESDRLFRNDNGKYTDVSAAAGIVNSSFGLSVTVGDINEDGYPDLFVGNDYIEPDYVYINQQDGTFKDEYFSMLRHSSQNTMGADIGDINNDGLLDIISLDMIAEDPVRYKELMNVMQYDRYEMLANYGYGHQVGRNVLHLNNGNGTYSEIAELAGVAATDWSWTPLFADFDNDGQQDLYITNGYRRDVTNLDYMTYTRDSISRTGGVNQKRFPDINTILNVIPEEKLNNYFYRNTGSLQFENKTREWGLGIPSFSNGAAYGDLDADGDLDLVVNNLLDPAFIFENKGTSRGNYLQISLDGTTQNRQALGAKVRVTAADGTQYFQEQQLNHGFFSTSEPILHFGVGENAMLSGIAITWPDQQVTILRDVPVNQRLKISYGKAEFTNALADAGEPPAVFKEESARRGLRFVHQENDFIDFKREQILPKKISTEGPAMAIGDLNGDGLDDLYIGGAAGQAGQLWQQSGSGNFSPLNTPALAEDMLSEDVAATFFDADGDRDLDLFVVSGGNAFPLSDTKYLDRLYLNEGNGNWAKQNLNIPPTSGGAVVHWDFDADGDQDLIVGGRVKPGAYPEAPLSYILQNQGGGQFSDATNSVFPELRELGMITDMAVGDLDGDGQKELVVAGEYLPIQVFSTEGQKIVQEDKGLAQSSGLWNSVDLMDIDGNGELDIVAGNEGQNTRLYTGGQGPLKCYFADFDNNGAIDPLLCYPHEGRYYPFASRDAFAAQMPEIKKRFSRYDAYARSTIEEILTPGQMQKAQMVEAKVLDNTIWYQQGGQFQAQSMPVMAQIAPVYGVAVVDYNQDQKPDLLLVGNYYGSATETGRYDAGNGGLLQNNGNQNLQFIPNRIHGFWASLEARDLALIRLANNQTGYLVANNNGPVQLFVLQSQKTPG